jgi:hypothetical protein
LRVTEDKWLACTAPREMLNHLDPLLRQLALQVSRRKLRLFACACCRRVWHLLGYETLRRAVEAAEHHADGLFTDAELEMARTAIHYERRAGHQAKDAVLNATGPGFLAYAVSTVAAAVDLVRRHARPVTLNSAAAERAAQAALVRDVFGNPFRPRQVDPHWASRGDAAVAKLALAIYDEHRFEDMPILADALEDAGCRDEEILAHCRGGGGHVRGCWLLDLVRSVD